MKRKSKQRWEWAARSVLACPMLQDGDGLPPLTLLLCSAPILTVVTGQSLDFLLFSSQATFQSSMQVLPLWLAYWLFSFYLPLLWNWLEEIQAFSWVSLKKNVSINVYMFYSFLLSIYNVLNYVYIKLSNILNE